MPETITCKWVRTAGEWDLQEGDAAKCKDTKPTMRAPDGTVVEVNVTEGGPG